MAIIFDFQKEMATVINRFKQGHFDVTQEALLVIAKELARIMESNTPASVSGAGTGLMKRSWMVAQYKNAVYVYNSRGAKGYNAGMPLTNITEYSSKGLQAFVIKTFEANKSLMVEKFKKEMYKRI